MSAPSRADIAHELLHMDVDRPTAARVEDIVRGAKAVATGELPPYLRPHDWAEPAFQRALVGFINQERAHFTAELDRLEATATKWQGALELAAVIGTKK